MNWEDFGDILDSKDVSKALRISRRSARAFMRENGAVLVAGKWLIGKARLIELFS